MIFIAHNYIVFIFISFLSLSSTNTVPKLFYIDEAAKLMNFCHIYSLVSAVSP